MKKTRKILLLMLLLQICAITLSAAPRDKVQAKGKVIDTEGAPIGFATVAFISRDSTVVAGGATAEDGTFTLEAVTGEYSLVASMIGYTDERRQCNLSQEINEIGDIVLKDDAKMLQEARVTGRVQLVEMKMDKIVMNVSQSVFAATSNALDLVKKAPGVTIDKDGNIKLNGKSVSIWIDGRPSQVDGKTLESLLRSTSGSSIEKFELMPNPSSKYDAQGQGGIINIKTKKNALVGFNGSLGASGAGMYFKKNDRFCWNEDFWANFNYRSGKTNTFLNIYEGIYNTDMDFSTELQTANPIFKQVTKSFQTNSYRAFNIKLGNDWFINDKNILGVIATVPGSWSVMAGKPGEVFNGWTMQTLKTDPDDEGVTSLNRSATDNNSKNLQTGANLNYTHIFNSDRSAELTTNLDWYRSANNDKNRIYSCDILQDGKEANPNSKLMSNVSAVNIISAKSDYQTVIWKDAMLEAGLKYAFSKTDNEMGKSIDGVLAESNDFTYDEHIAAAYFSLSKPFAKYFSIKAGLRGEYTRSLGNWKSFGTTTPRSYFDLFPTFFFGYNRSENMMLSISYTKRIDRPNYYNLNPAESYVDAHSYMKGNPDLQPQYTNSVSANVVLYKHFSISTGYDHTGNLITQLPSYKTNGDQMLVWGNFGALHMAYITVNVSAFPITKWLNWTTNLNGMYSANISGDIRNNCFFFAGYTDFTFILPKDWKIQIDGRYSTPMTWGQFKVGTMWTCNFGVKKTLLDNRLTLSLDIDDIFRSSNQHITIVGSDQDIINSMIKQDYYNQKVKIGLTWNFGQAQRQAFRKVGQIDEASRLTSGGIGGK